MVRALKSIRAARRFRDYRPKPLTWTTAMRWADQFGRRDRALAMALLDSVVYLSERRTRAILVEQNSALMSRVAAAGLPAKKLIYVQVHDAGSSSPVMLNLLRDAANLEKRGCRFVDARDVAGVNKAMSLVGTGALVYVDDFLGTGRQFCGARDFLAKNLALQTFSEFLVAPCICEEAFPMLSMRGIEWFTGHVHARADRPLHQNCAALRAEQRERLARACAGIDRRFGLGYGDLATMVVLYRNAPNTVPALLRGCANQTPLFGVFPRTTDLPLTGPP